MRVLLWLCVGGADKVRELDRVCWRAVGGGSTGVNQMLSGGTSLLAAAGINMSEAVTVASMREGGVSGGQAWCVGASSSHHLVGPYAGRHARRTVGKRWTHHCGPSCI